MTRAPRPRRRRRAASGEIVISGSSTVEPITLDRGRGLHQPTTRTSSTRSTAPAPATGSRSSAPARSTSPTRRAPSATRRRRSASEAGIEYVELQIGDRRHQRHHVAGERRRDLPQLRGPLRAHRPGAQGFDNWTDADALGAGDRLGDFGEIHAPFPDAPLDDHRTGRGVGHVRHASSSSSIARSRRGSAAPTRRPRPDYTTRADDNVIIEGIAGSPDARSAGSASRSPRRTRDIVKSLEVDGGDGCVAPTPETIASASTRSAAPLFIYVNTAKAAENAPSSSAFVDYYLSDEGIAAVTRPTTSPSATRHSRRRAPPGTAADEASPRLSPGRTSPSRPARIAISTLRQDDAPMTASER